ncbi:unnamed protein product [Chrysoparadoxa australica]
MYNKLHEYLGPPPPPTAPPQDASPSFKAPHDEPITGDFQGLGFNELVEEKERELHQITMFRVQALEKALASKEEQLVEGREKFNKLRDDFKYNLQLFEDRDAELARFEATLEGLKDCLRIKEHEVSELRKQLDTEVTRQQTLEAREAEQAAYWRVRAKDLADELESLKWSHEDEVRRMRDTSEAMRQQLSKQLREAEEEVASQRKDLGSTFDDVLRQREAEAQRRQEEMEVQLSNMGAQAAEEKRNAEALEKECSRLAEDLAAARKDKSEAQTALRAAKWEAGDVNQLIRNELEEVAKQRDLALQDNEEMSASYEEKLQELVSSLQAVEAAFVQQKARHEEQVKRDEASYQRKEQTWMSEKEGLMKQVAEAQSLADELESQQTGMVRSLREAAVKGAEDLAEKEAELRAREVELIGELQAKSRDVRELRNQEVSQAGELARARAELQGKDHELLVLTTQLEEMSSEQSVLRERGRADVALIEELRTQLVQASQQGHMTSLADLKSSQKEKEELLEKIHALEKQLTLGEHSPMFSEDMGPASPLQVPLSGQEYGPSGFSVAVTEAAAETEAAMSAENQRLHGVISQMRVQLDELRSRMEAEGMEQQKVLQDLKERLELAQGSEKAAEETKEELEKRCTRLERDLVHARSERDKLIELSNKLRADVARLERESSSANGFRDDMESKYQQRIGEIEVALSEISMHKSQRSLLSIADGDAVGDSRMSVSSQDGAELAVRGIREQQRMSSRASVIQAANRRFSRTAAAGGDDYMRGNQRRDSRAVSPAATDKFGRGSQRRDSRAVSNAATEGFDRGSQRRDSRAVSTAATEDFGRGFQRRDSRAVSNAANKEFGRGNQRRDSRAASPAATDEFGRGNQRRDSRAVSNAATEGFGRGSQRRDSGAVSPAATEEFGRGSQRRDSRAVSTAATEGFGRGSQRRDGGAVSPAATEEFGRGSQRRDSRAALNAATEGFGRGNQRRDSRAVSPAATDEFGRGSQRRDSRAVWNAATEGNVREVEALAVDGFAVGSVDQRSLNRSDDDQTEGQRAAADRLKEAMARKRKSSQ